METNEKILETIKNADRPLKASEISEMSGLDKKIVDKAIKELKTREMIVSPKFCFYSVK